MADRIGVINKGEVILVEEKHTLMQKLGEKSLTLHLQDAISEIPPALQQFNLEVKREGMDLVYSYDTQHESSDITALLDAVEEAGIAFMDLETRQNSLEEIFVNLVKK